MSKLENVVPESTPIDFTPFLIKNEKCGGCPKPVLSASLDRLKGWNCVIVDLGDWEALTNCQRRYVQTVSQYFIDHSHADSTFDKKCACDECAHQLLGLAFQKKRRKAAERCLQFVKDYLRRENILDEDGDVNWVIEAINAVKESA